MTSAVPHEIRDAVDADIGFVVNAWVEEMRLSPSSWGLPNTDYYSWQRAYIRQQLRDATTLIACAPDDSRHMYGYVTFSAPNYIHWCYVKSAYRQLGLAASLIERAIGRPSRIYVTQASNSVLQHLRAKREHSRIVYIAPQYLTHARESA